MEENTQNEYTEPIKYTKKQKLENFWYHYKWRTIIALFVLITVLICTLSFCQKTEYDTYVMYAGPYDTTFSEEKDTLTFLSNICPDLNGDGEKSVSYLSLFLMTNDQIKARNAVGDGYEVNTNLVKDNLEIFNQTVQIGETEIFLLDPNWFNYLYNETENENFLAKIAAYTDESKTYEYYNECGIYLRSTNLCDLPGFSNLPDDTVICIRTNGSLSSLINKKASAENHKKSEEFLRVLLSY